MSYVMSSKPRFRILTELRKGNKIPTELAKILDSPISHISTTLKELEIKELVECLTSERRKNKFFKITNKGEGVLGDIGKETKR
ncbi:MAG: winged helix DNA-binding protein [Nanoarchaeota archaeon]